MTLAGIWTQFAKKHILRLEPLHLATKANSIACVACCVDCSVSTQVQSVNCGVRCCCRGVFQDPPLRDGQSQVWNPPLRDGFGQTRPRSQSMAFRASDLSQIWTQFAKKHVLRLEPLHLAISANSIAGVAAPTRPTFHVFKSQVGFAIKR